MDQTHGSLRSFFESPRFRLQLRSKSEQVSLALLQLGLTVFQIASSLGEGSDEFDEARLARRKGWERKVSGRVP